MKWRSTNKNHTYAPVTAYIAGNNEVLHAFSHGFLPQSGHNNRLTTLQRLNESPGPFHKMCRLWKLSPAIYVPFVN